jgi:hypothetical protein
MAQIEYLTFFPNHNPVSIYALLYSSFDLDFLVRLFE